MQFYSGSEEIETTVEKVREEEKGLGEREKWVSKGVRKGCRGGCLSASPIKVCNHFAVSCPCLPAS